jgi:peptidoglycan LD-endopeptidase CwlK
MIDSRDVNSLLPAVRDKALHHQSLCAAEEITVIFTSTLRDYDCQAAIYAKGRTVCGPDATPDRPMGRTLTNAKPGESFHQFRVAYDLAILQAGRCIWDDHPEGAALWSRVGHLGELAGLEWAGRWTSFRELAHFQDTGGLTLAQLKAAAA